MSERASTWEGGVIRYNRKGRATFVIQRMVKGERFFVSTRAHDEVAAMRHLRRFEEDPGGYSPVGSPRKQPIHLDDRLILDFVKHSREVDGNSASWVHQQKIHLQNFWKPKLAGVDLRKARLVDIRKVLEGGVPSEMHRVAVLKRLYSWLISQGRVEPSEDPTFRRLSAPKGKPKEQPTFSIEDFKKVRNAMTNPHRAAFIVQCATGMHATELHQLATVGRIEEPEAGRTDGAAAILYVPKHKSGLPYRVAVSEAVKAAAEALRKHGAFSVERYLKAVRAACKSVGVAAITSRKARHTAMTYAVSRGVSVQAAGEYCGHADARTTRIYAQNAPPKVPTIV